MFFIQNIFSAVIKWCSLLDHLFIELKYFQVSNGVQYSGSVFGCSMLRGEKENRLKDEIQNCSECLDTGLVRFSNHNNVSSSQRVQFLNGLIKIDAIAIYLIIGLVIKWLAIIIACLCTVVWKPVQFSNVCGHLIVRTEKRLKLKMVQVFSCIVFERSL
jgi:hypothetical protein